MHTSTNSGDLALSRSDIRFNNTPFAQGGAFTADEVQPAMVCILSDNAYTEIYSRKAEMLSEQSIYAGNYRYIIVGVQAPPKTGVVNASFGGDIAIPYTVYEQHYLHGRVAFAGRFTVADSALLLQTEVAVLEKLQSLHRNAKAEGNIKRSTSNRFRTV